MNQETHTPPPGRDHPLWPFFLAMCAEYGRGLAKYGPWSEIDDERQKGAVIDEFFEWANAELAGNHLSEHGTLDELPQLAAVAGKRYNELMRRANDGQG